MNTAHLSDELLIAYAAKELDQEQGRLVEEHIGACLECNTIVASFKTVWGIAHGDFDQDPSPQVVARANAIIRQPIASPVSIKPMSTIPSLLGILGSLGRRLLVPATAAFALFVIFIMGQFTLASADSSLPGDLFYPVKLDVEALQLTVTLDPNDKTELLLNIAQKRLDEAQALTQLERFELIPQTVSAYEDAISEATTKIKDLAKDNSLIDTVSHTADTTLTQNIIVLTNLLNQVPPQAQPAIQNAINASKTHQVHQDKDNPSNNPQPNSIPTRTRTPQPPNPPSGQTKSPAGPQPPGQTIAPGLQKTPDAPTKTPGSPATPPGLAKTPGNQSQPETPPGKDKTPESNGSK